MHKFGISFLYSWIYVLDLNQPLKWRAEIWEPFKMKLIQGIQSWTLLEGDPRWVSMVSWFVRHFSKDPETHNLAWDGWHKVDKVNVNTFSLVDSSRWWIRALEAWAGSNCKSGLKDLKPLKSGLRKALIWVSELKVRDFPMWWYRWGALLSFNIGVGG